MNKKWTIISLSAFVLIELSFLMVVLFGKGDVKEAFSFSSIALAFVFSLAFLSFKHDSFVIQFALMFTVLADLFLVFGQWQNKALAMSFFSITQILYFVYLLKTTPNKKIRFVNLLSRIIAIVGVLVATLVVLKGKADYLSLISMFYFTNIVFNTFFAFFNCKRNPFFAIGLLLFLICDIFIGLQVAIGNYIYIDPNSIIYQIVFSPFNWAWLCYIPSQSLIVIASWYHLQKIKKLKA